MNRDDHDHAHIRARLAGLGAPAVVCGVTLASLIGPGWGTDARPAAGAVAAAPSAPGRSGELVAVPSVYGLTVAGARAAVEAAGLRVELRRVACGVTDVCVAGLAGVEPDAGAVVPRGSTVTILGR